MSSGRLSAEAVRQALHTARGYVKDLLDSLPADSTDVTQRFGIFNTKLRLLSNCLEKDDVLRWVAGALHVRSGDVRAWYHAAATGGSRALPEAPSARLAHLLGLLTEVKKGQIELRALVSTLYADQEGFRASFVAFRDRVLEAFAKGLDTLFRGLESRLESDAPFDAIVEGALDAWDAEARRLAAPAAPAPQPAAKDAAAPRRTAAKKSGAGGAAVTKRAKKPAAPKGAAKKAAAKPAGARKAGGATKGAKKAAGKKAKA